jgi:hypothetical protein
MKEVNKMKFINVLVTKNNNHFAGSDYVAENELEAYKAKFVEDRGKTINDFNFRIRTSMNMNVEFVENGTGMMVFMNNRYREIHFKRIH